MAVAATPKKEKVCRVLLLGEIYVGKTSIINRKYKGAFSTDVRATLGLNFLPVLHWIDEKPIKIVLVDTGGQERFRALVPSVCKRSDIIVLVYDVTQRDTFEKLDDWLDVVKEYTCRETNDLAVMVLGNKTDLEGREVSTEEGMKFAEQHGMEFFEVSAKTGDKIEEAFEFMIENLVDNELLGYFEENIVEASPASEAQHRSRCCFWRSHTSTSAQYTAPQPHQIPSALKIRDRNGTTGLEEFQYPPENVGELQDLAVKVSMKWKVIARHLKVPENTIDSFNSQYVVEGKDECLMKVFDWWQKNQTIPYTWSTVIDILEKASVGQCAVAADLRNTLERRKPNSHT